MTIVRKFGFGNLLNWPLFTVLIQLGMSLFNLAYVNNALIDIAVKMCCGKDSSDDSQEVMLQKEKDSKIPTVKSISAKVAWNEKLK